MAHTINTDSGERKIPVVASKGTTIKVSEELLRDSVFDLDSCIASKFAHRIGAREEESFFNGDGNGKPLGILAANGGAEIGVTAASATAITADEIMDLYHSLKAPYRNKDVWVMSDATVKAIRKLKDNISNFIWQSGFTEDKLNTILGRPVYTSVYMPEPAEGAKTIAFGNFDHY